ncbi:MAG: hypothetical protein WKF71_15505 [Pyrinomonadaceae bacterium]
MNIAYADDIRGELRRNLSIVPLVTVSSDSNLLIIPTAPKVQKRRHCRIGDEQRAARNKRNCFGLNLPSGLDFNARFG